MARKRTVKPPRPGKKSRKRPVRMPKANIGTSLGTKDRMKGGTTQGYNVTKGRQTASVTGANQGPASGATTGRKKKTKRVGGRRKNR